MATQPDCFGRLFPDLTTLDFNQPCEGKAFTVQTQCQGLGLQAAYVEVDQNAWAACQECASYRSCYDLSAATLMLRQAIARL
jgi:hypothetical protein